MAKKEYKYDELLGLFKQRKFAPVYLFMGEEPYFIDSLSNYLIENVLSPDEQTFDQTVVYGADTTIEAVINLAKRFPMQAQYQLIVVKEAQKIKNFEQLEHYLKNLQQKTILVICYKYGNVDKRKSFLKKIETVGVVFESKKIYDNQLPSWITSLVREKGKSIDNKAANMLAEHLGTDLSRVVNEVEKLETVLASSGEKAITPEMVEKNIGISKEFNNFELEDALAEKNVLKANRIVNYFKSNKDFSIELSLLTLYKFFSNLLILTKLETTSDKDIAQIFGISPYFVSKYKRAKTKYSQDKLKRIIGYLHEANRQSRGMDWSAKPGEILELLIFKILH